MDQTIKISAEPQDDTTCRFQVDRPVLDGGSIYFDSKERAAGSPLAEKLFDVDGIESVLVQDNRVTVNAQTGGDWMPLANQVGAAIRSVLESGEKAVSDSVLDALPSADEIAKRVRELLEKEINPAIAAHGGFVSLIDVKGNEIFIQMGGGCQGCGMADVTLKQGIEKTIRQHIPEVGAIMDTTDHATGRNPYYEAAK